MTSHTGRNFLLTRVPLKSRTKYQFVTSLISYLSVLLSTYPEHISYYSASIVSTLFNNFHANGWSYCTFFFIFGGSNCDGNVSYNLITAVRLYSGALFWGTECNWLISPLRTVVLFLSFSLSYNCNTINAHLHYLEFIAEHFQSI